MTKPRDIYVRYPLLSEEKRIKYGGEQTISCQRWVLTTKEGQCSIRGVTLGNKGAGDLSRHVCCFRMCIIPFACAASLSSAACAAFACASPLSSAACAGEGDCNKKLHSLISVAAVCQSQCGINFWIKFKAFAVYPAPKSTWLLDGLFLLSAGPRYLRWLDGPWK